jgi:sulfoxide reductase catalytic subunit YedY
MAHIRIPRGWELPERLATPESVYQNRREFLKRLGFSGLGALAAIPRVSGHSVLYTAFADERKVERFIQKSPSGSLYPAKRNPAFVLDLPLTRELMAAQYNNFYEFSEKKETMVDTGERRMTELYNGYGEWVSRLYKS